MSTRMVTDCDRCGKENVSDTFRLEITVAGEKKRLDLDTKCLGSVLQEQISKLDPVESRELYDRVYNQPARKTKSEKPAEAVAKA